MSSYRRAVLGIDAAWTQERPSGVALVGEVGTTWKLIALSPSYEHFYCAEMGDLSPDIRRRGSRLDVTALLSASSKLLCGSQVDLVAIDMPLAHGPIKGRRVSDDAVSRAYGARKCGTHTPSELRPGPISDELKEKFGEAGFHLQTVTISTPGLIEVYPHPAIVELANASERLRYKVSKVRNYWPTSTTVERRTFLFQEWARIIALLETRIVGVESALPKLLADTNGNELKAYEDKLDAVVCAWVAICALEGQAKPFGDQQSAI